MAGGNFIPQGSFNPQVSRSIADMSNVDPSLPAAPGTATIDHLQFRDAFSAGPSFGIETGYMTESNVEPFLRLSYSELHGRNTTIGNITSPALDSPTEISADFAT